MLKSVIFTEINIMKSNNRFMDINHIEGFDSEIKYLEITRSKIPLLTNIVKTGREVDSTLSIATQLSTRYDACQKV